MEQFAHINCQYARICLLLLVTLPRLVEALFFGQVNSWTWLLWRQAWCCKATDSARGALPGSVKGHSLPAEHYCSAVMSKAFCWQRRRLWWYRTSRALLVWARRCLTERASMLCVHSGPVQPGAGLCSSAVGGKMAQPQMLSACLLLHWEKGFVKGSGAAGGGCHSSVKTKLYFVPPHAFCWAFWCLYVSSEYVGCLRATTQLFCFVLFFHLVYLFNLARATFVIENYLFL